MSMILKERTQTTACAKNLSSMIWKDLMIDSFLKNKREQF